MNANGKKLTGRDLKAIERKKQILESAKKLFAKNGYYNTPVRAITQSIGMADGLIYHYFPEGKLEILHTICREGCEIVSQHSNDIVDSVDDTMPLDEVMMCFCESLKANFKFDSDFIVIMAREKELLGEEIKELLRKSFGKAWSELNKFLRHRVEIGEIKELEFDMATHQIMATVSSALIMNFLLENIPKENSYDYMKRLIHFTIDSWKN